MFIGKVQLYHPRLTDVDEEAIQCPDGRNTSKITIEPIIPGNNPIYEEGFSFTFFVWIWWREVLVSFFYHIAHKKIMNLFHNFIVSTTLTIALFMVRFSHLHYNGIQCGCESISR